MNSYDQDHSLRYPWRTHVFMLFPLIVATLFIGFLFGWFGDPVRLAFISLRREYPFVTSILRFITNFGNPLLYFIYVVLLGLAVYIRDTKRLWDIICLVAISLLTLCIILQIVKYGLGIPRPGIPWPPQSWASREYTSFPSGHTTSIIVFAIPLSIWTRCIFCKCFLSLLIAGMGISRIWLGEHHPMDIVGSILFGSLITWLIIRCTSLPIFQKQYPKINLKKR